MSISTVYRVSLHYEGDAERIENAYFAMNLGNTRGVLSQESFFGCPAAGPYLTVECTTRRRAEMIEKRLQMLVRKTGGKVES